MDLNAARSWVVLTGLAVFLVLMVWTWWPSQRKGHDEAALLPFLGEAGPSVDAAQLTKAKPAPDGTGNAA